MSRSPTLTDGLRAAPGAVVEAVPLGRANQSVARLAAEAQQALGFEFLASQTGTVRRSPWVAADSWAYTCKGNVKSHSENTENLTQKLHLFILHHFSYLSFYY